MVGPLSGGRRNTLARGYHFPETLPSFQPRAALATDVALGLRLMTVFEEKKTKTQTVNYNHDVNEMLLDQKRSKKGRAVEVWCVRDRKLQFSSAGFTWFHLKGRMKGLRFLPGTCYQCSSSACAHDAATSDPACIPVPAAPLALWGAGHMLHGSHRTTQ